MTIPLLTGGIIPAALAQGEFLGGLDSAINEGKTQQGMSDISFETLFGNMAVFLVALVASVALAALAWGGMMYILSLGDEARSARAKHIILFAIIGLLLAGIAELIRNIVWCKILEADQQKYTFCYRAPGVERLVEIILTAIGVLLAPAGAIAFGALVYGGYLYITSGGEESRAARAKQAIFYALLGLAVIGAAGIIVNIIINII